MQSTSASKLRRYRATIVPHVLREKSFHGTPRPGTMEKFEVCEKDVAAMLPKMAGLPMCYNHDMSEVVGRIVASYRNPATNSWDIEYELNGATPKGAEYIQWVDDGHMKGVSLQHRWGENTPLEVSLCWRGMRPGSHTYSSAVAASYGQVYWDSNQSSYIRDRDALLSTVCASADGLDDDDLVIFDVMNNDVRASATAADDTAAAPAPAAAAAAATTAPASPPPPQFQYQQPLPPQAPVQPQQPLAPLMSKEAMFPTFEAMRGLLNSNPTIDPTARAQISKTVADLEVANAKERDRANQLALQLQAYKDEATKKQAALEEEMRRKLEESNRSVKEKVGDFAKAFQDINPNLATELAPVLASATPETLSFLSSLGDTVQAAFVQRNQATTAAMQAESSMNEYRSQLEQQYYSQQQQQRQWQVPEPVTATPAAAGAAPDTGALVQASRQGNDTNPGYTMGSARVRPRPNINVRAAHKQRAVRATNGKGYYQPAEEYEQNEMTDIKATWEPGAGGRVNLTRVSPDKSVMAAVDAIWDAAPAGDGCGGDPERLFIRNIWQNPRDAEAARDYELANSRTETSQMTSRSSSNMYMQRLGKLER